MEFKSLSSQMGAQVIGLDLTKPLAKDDSATLNEAFYRYRVLLFRQGPISEEHHVRLMSVLGNVVVEQPGGDPVTYVSTTVDEKVMVRGTMAILFHSEYQFTHYGAIQGQSLYALDVQRDEPTIFADMVRAAKAIPPALRQRIGALDVIQCIDFAREYSEGSRFRMSQKTSNTPDDKFPHAQQPLLRRHPITGEEVLNVSQLFTSHIVGMDEATSDVVFAELNPYQYNSATCYSHRWQNNDLLIWDNYALQHAREALEQAYGRHLRRVVINPVDAATFLSGFHPDAVPGLKGGWPTPLRSSSADKPVPYSKSTVDF